MNHLAEQGIIKKSPIGDGSGGPIKLIENRTGKPVPTMAPQVDDGPVLGFRDIRFEPNADASESTRDIIVSRNRNILSIDTPADQGATQAK